ncbi:hypothetical protein BC628DRAFT_1337997 [Trametes gibbosa]|nr:hypothetical protein BC628DRAFT_1337997 [Trametes gibbosa]
MAPKQRNTNTHGPPPLTPPGSPDTKKTSTETTGRDIPHLHVFTEPVASTSGDTIATELTTRALNELAQSQIRVLSVLASGFDVLAKQTLDVITIGPATEAMRKVQELRAEIIKHHDGGRVDPESAKAFATSKVKLVMREFVRPQIQKMVAEAIAQEIGARVQIKLKEQVSEDLKKKLAEFRHRVECVKIKLINNDARWRNSLISSEAAGVQPLQRLLRPPVPLGYPLGTANVDGVGAGTANGDGRTGSKRSKPQKKSKAGAEGDAPATGAGTPSPDFPRTTDDITTIDAPTARRLVEDYNIPTPAASESDGWEDVGDDEGGSKKADEKNKDAKSGRATPDTRGGGPRGDTNKAKSARDKENEEREKREAALKATERRRVADLNAFMNFIGARARTSLTVDYHADACDSTSAALVRLCTTTMCLACSSPDDSCKRASMGAAMFLVWYTVSVSLGDGIDAGLGHLELLESAPSENGTPTSPLFERPQGAAPVGLW